MTFDHRSAKIAHAGLRRRFHKVESGLSEGELAAIEDAIGTRLPPDLSLFWSVGYPTGAGWPDWRTDPRGQATSDREWVLQAFRFDIRENDYWLDTFGPRPASLEAAISLAIEVVSGWPPLVRLYSHRFMPTDPPVPGNPVLSVWQAVDSVVYGVDLADYLNGEFGLKVPRSLGTQGLPRSNWDLAFDL